MTETILTQGVNKELIESADYQKNRKKASTKDADKISDTRVLSLEMMDEAIRIKAEKKKQAEEKLTKEKRLKAQAKQWQSLYNHTLVQLRKWGPEILQEVENY
jgi:DNA gyrase/topoisomerase IV subunit A